MTSYKLTKRHGRYLSRFKRQRSGFDWYSENIDLERLRRCEKAYFSQMLYFLILSPAWLDALFIWTWWTVPSVLIVVWIGYMFYDRYWVSKSVDYMISSGIQDLPEAGLEDGVNR